MTENGQCEGGWTVTPEMGLEILEGAKKAVFDAFEGQGDSPASAVASAIVGYRNAVREIHELRDSSDSAERVLALCLKMFDEDDGERGRGEEFRAAEAAVRHWAENR